MGTIENTHDAALRTLPFTSDTHALELYQDMVSVHGVFDSVGRNEDVAIQLWHWRVRHDKAVAVVVQDEAASNLVATRKGLNLLRRFTLGQPRRRRRICFLFSAGEAVPTARELLYRFAFLELSKNLEKRAGVGFLEFQSPRDLVCGGRLAPKLQKTQYLIGAES
jgi:hypothetical protein